MGTPTPPIRKIPMTPPTDMHRHKSVNSNRPKPPPRPQTARSTVSSPFGIKPSDDYKINSPPKHIQQRSMTESTTNTTKKRVAFNDEDTDNQKENDDDNLPPEWQKNEDQYGRVYYQNNATKKTQWDRPQKKEKKKGRY